MTEVSTFIITYNQREFIRDAVMSVVEQRFRGSHEIIVSDDASTDGTKEAILELAQCHPNLIRPIFVDRNTGFQENVRRALLACRGRYIAILEGDDLWIDPYKLQRQVDAFERMPDAQLVFSRGRIRLPNGSERSGWNFGPDERMVSAGELLHQTGIMVPTASMIARAEIWKQLPEWVWIAPVLDSYLLLAGAVQGGALYQPSEMVLYRSLAAGSWTSQLAAKPERQRATARAFIESDELAIRQYNIDRRLLKWRSSPHHHLLGRHAIREGNLSAAAAHFAKLDARYVRAQAKERFRRTWKRIFGGDP